MASPSIVSRKVRFSKIPWTPYLRIRVRGGNNLGGLLPPQTPPRAYAALVRKSRFSKLSNFPTLSFSQNPAPQKQRHFENDAVSDLQDRGIDQAWKFLHQNVYESFWRGFLPPVMTILWILKRQHISKNCKFEKEAVSGLLTMWDRSGVKFVA